MNRSGWPFFSSFFLFCCLVILICLRLLVSISSSLFPSAVLLTAAASVFSSSFHPRPHQHLLPLPPLPPGLLLPHWQPPGPHFLTSLPIVGTPLPRFISSTASFFSLRSLAVISELVSTAVSDMVGRPGYPVQQAKEKARFTDSSSTVPSPHLMRGCTDLWPRRTGS